MTFVFRNSDPSHEVDEHALAPIHRYATVEEVEWSRFPVNERVRLIVQPSADVLPLDVLFIRRPSTRLLVGLHGAETQAKTSLPKFQFVRSFSARSESVLFLSDSTLLHAPSLTIGWMVGNSRIDVAEGYTDLINRLRVALGFEQVVLAGHSAGGTSAVRIGWHVPNSLAIAVNGQVDATIHRPYLLPNLRKAVFPEVKKSAELVEKYPHRFSLLAQRAPRAHGARFAWFTHADDKLSFDKHPHFHRLVEHFGVGHRGGDTKHGDMIRLGRWDNPSTNDHALPGGIMPFVHIALGEPTTKDIGLIDPVAGH